MPSLRLQCERVRLQSAKSLRFDLLVSDIHRRADEVRIPLNRTGTVEVVMPVFGDVRFGS